MAVRIVMQARLASLRLPAKVLLPIAGFPVVVLAAKRATNTDIPIVVAIPDNPEEDPLEEFLVKNELKVCRGPHEDVLRRFVLATHDMQPDDMVVRLTADNVIPDGNLIDGALNEFEITRSAYLTTAFTTSHIPYGASLEIFRVKALREANGAAKSADEREHVTPWMRRNLEPVCEYRPFFTKLDCGHLRGTLDHFEDYLNLTTVFKSVWEPLYASWLELCQRILDLNKPCIPRIPLNATHAPAQSELTLGTAQLGMPYGVTQDAGKPSVEEAHQIIKTAVNWGVMQLDTARAYGETEQRIGELLRQGLSSRVRVITKLDPLSQLPAQASAAEVHTFVDASILRSMYALGLAKLPVVLLHRWAHYQSHKGAIWERLLKLQQEGRIGSLGASISEPGEMIEALAEKAVQYLQFPFNILDRRWKQAGLEEAVEKQNHVTIHARSVFLQGLLASDLKSTEEVMGSELGPELEKLDTLVERFGRESRADLCLAYVRAQRWIHSIVLGVSTLEQLQINRNLFQKAPLKEQECALIEQEFQNIPVDVLNPAMWRGANSYEKK